MPPTNLMSPLLWQSIPFADVDSYQDWLGVHDDWHHVLADLTGTRWLQFDDLKVNLLSHAQVHILLSRALQIAPPGDLMSYDLNDRASWQGFMQIHGDDHNRLRIAAGV